ncbi:glutamine amidotransferase [Rhizobiales bacterium GAS191]|jgi:predicted glutamine amidotransferase|nr:glutamine amidotransferase [Rhizobiales bacterium GAS113]SEC21641.1 glutamine amidotransferase [Rhizobiales bacterium GAS191]SED01115.1 glutamine amidotransferase [Rhizobiales bacterium GAS188]
MCRFLAYRGATIFLEDLVSSPCHSLIRQSLSAEESKAPTNGDGFGVGWYGERDEPGHYREVRPAWSDENLLSLARQVRSGLFFAHVRAATGTATTRANCHPFVRGRFMFMHNGQVGGWSRVRRAIESLIPDELYLDRLGTTDSEALFLRILARIDEGLAPLDAMQATLAEARSLMRKAGVKEALRFAAALTDGRDLFAVRWASDDKPPSLYLCEREDCVIVASEPVDEARECWQALGPHSALIARAGETARIAPFEIEKAAAA